MLEEITRSVRNLDKDTYHKARGAALQAGVLIGRWITEAIQEKLEGFEERARYAGWKEPR